MPKLQTYDIYTILAAGGTKTYVSNDSIDVYEINANGGSVVLLADMIFLYSGTPNIASEFKFQYGGGVTSNSVLGRTVSFFGTHLTDAQALNPLIIRAYWNGISWEIMIIKDTKNNVVSATTFGSVPNANALTIATGGVINMQPASDLFGGGVSTTTQTFAGAKTFNVLSGNVSIDAIGVGIGVAASTSRFFNITKTFTSLPPSLSVNVGLLNSVIFNYSSANSDQYTFSSANYTVSVAEGIHTPNVLNATSLSTGSNMQGATILKSIVTRSGHASTGSETNNAITIFNADFLSATIAAKNSNATSFNITDNYSYYSAIPFQNNNVAALTPSLFTITKQFGYYCENYKGANKTPVIFDSGAMIKVSAVITDAWQLYMSGTTLTTIGSYIGNRLGIAFATEPTTNSQVTAFVHIGPCVSGSAQIRLVNGVAPSAPNDGDIWREDNTNTGLKVRVNGITKTVSLV